MVVTLKTYSVSGVVRNRLDGAPVEGVVVQAFDRDFFREQALGVAVTNASGRYDIRFDRDDFTGPIPLERAPDIFLVFTDHQGRELASTERSVVLNAGEETRIDMAIAVPKPRPKPAPPARIAIIRGEPVDLIAAARLTGEEIVEAYRYLRGRGPAPKRLELIREAFPLLKMRYIGDCGEARHAALRQIAREKGIFVLDRDMDADDFSPGITVRSFYTAHILVRYTTDPADPANIVEATLPAADAPVYLSDGTTAIGILRANLADLDPTNTEVAPTYVQQIGVIAENAITKYLAAPYDFRDPRNGATRLEYRLLDQGGDFGSTNPGWSHVEIDPGLTLEQLLHSVPHEMFHQVQYRYHDTTTTTGFYSMLREGGCRLIEDCVDDASNRWVKDAATWLGNPLRSLQNGEPLTTSYHAGLFWKYVAEQHSFNVTAADEPAIGIDSYRRALEQTATVEPADPGLGYTLDALHQTFNWALPYCPSFDRFAWYSIPAGELSTSETTWGNFVVANALHALASPVSDGRFDYMEDDAAVLWSTSPVGSLAAAQVFIDASNDLLLSPGTSITRNVTAQSPYAATYYRVTPSGAPRMLRLTFTGGAGVIDPLVQIIRLGAGSALVDLHRSDQPSWTKTINMDALTSVIVIAATREHGGDYTIAFDEIDAASDVMITRWNTFAGQELDANPRAFGWTWISPDIMVDTNNDGLRDTEVYFGVDNTLKVHLRNRGNATADGVQVQFWYQKATPALSPTAWIPLTDALGAVQISAPISLAAGADQWVAVNWAPVDDGSHESHWCVKAQVIAPGDANTDNKVALSNFTHVVEGADHDLSQLVRSLSLAASNVVHVVPRGPNFTFVAKGEPIGDRLVRPRAAALPRFDACQPDNVTFLKYGVVRTAKLTAWNGRELTAEPRPDTFYPVGPQLLPPGTNSENLVTILQVADGRIIGGVTYEVIPRK